MFTNTTVVKPTAPLFDEARLAIAGFLARYSGATRVSYATDLRQYFTWCAQPTSTSSPPGGATSSCTPARWRSGGWRAPPLGDACPPWLASTASP